MFEGLGIILDPLDQYPFMRKSLQAKIFLGIGGSLTFISVLGFGFAVSAQTQDSKAAEFIAKESNQVQQVSVDDNDANDRIIEVSSNDSNGQIVAADAAGNPEFVPQLPAKDLTLPTQNSIKISGITVDAPIIQGQDPEQALKQGAWIAPEFKTPSGNALLNRNEPVIIASHVYGYPDWDEDFRDRIAFAGLDDLQAGDIVEIVWQQRKYIYEITAGEVNTEISSYDHDLILYTCVDLSGSDERVIKYANLRNDLI